MPQQVVNMKHIPPCDFLSVPSSTAWTQRVRKELAVNDPDSPEVTKLVAAFAKAETAQSVVGSALSGSALSSAAASNVTSSELSRKITELEQQLIDERHRRREVEMQLEQRGLLDASRPASELAAPIWTGTGLAYRRPA